MSRMSRRNLMLRLAVLLAGAATLAACGAPKNPPPPQATDAAGRDVIGAPLHQALDKANSVEGTVQQQKDDVDKAVDQAD